MMETRLGDIIDDYCVKCKRITNHAVVSMVEDTAAKVRCRTCYSDHDYRHEQAPPPKVDPRKAALYAQVLDKMNVPEAPAKSEPAVADGLDNHEPGEAAAHNDSPAAPKSKRARK